MAVPVGRVLGVRSRRGGRLRGWGRGAQDVPRRREHRSPSHQEPRPEGPGLFWTFLTRIGGSGAGIGAMLREGWVRSAGGAYEGRTCVAPVLPRHRADPGRSRDLSGEKGSPVAVRSKRRMDGTPSLRTSRSLLAPPRSSLNPRERTPGRRSRGLSDDLGGYRRSRGPRRQPCRGEFPVRKAHCGIIHRENSSSYRVILPTSESTAPVNADRHPPAAGRQPPHGALHVPAAVAVHVRPVCTKARS